MGVILDQQNGRGHEQKANPRQEPLERSGPVRIGQHDEDHHKIAHGLHPALERYVGVVGPKDAIAAVNEKHKDRPIRSQERSNFSSSSEKHCHAGRDEPCQDVPVEGAPIQELFG